MDFRASRCRGERRHDSGNGSPHEGLSEHRKAPSTAERIRGQERRGLLAKIHVAKKQMGLNDGEYEMVLRSFRVASSAN
jgi:hypothetical protein